MTLTAAYDDNLVRVFHADHAELAAHLRETGERPDAMIVDAPYSERTHAGHDVMVEHLGASDNARRTVDRRAIEYAAWTPHDVASFAGIWSEITSGWVVSLTDHVLGYEWAAAFDDMGRYVFPPLPCIERGGRVRLAGDGPSSWTTWAVVARPKARRFMSWGTLPGSYEDGPERKPWVGGKPVWLIRALVRDYSRPGDLIVDPCCGAGTLGVAVRYEGRRAILADRDPAAVETTIKRLRGERTKPTRDDYPETAEQPSLFARGAAE